MAVNICFKMTSSGRSGVILTLAPHVPNQFYIARLEGLKPGVYEDKFNLAVTYNGAGTKQGDAAINAEVNAFLEELKTNGKTAELYQKWMKLPLPEFPDSVPGIPFTVQ